MFGVGIDPANNVAELSAAELETVAGREGAARLLLDTRNDYGNKLGTFRNAVPIGVDHFAIFRRRRSALFEPLKERPMTFVGRDSVRRPGR
ncbi:MAG: hypothetical protein R3C99_01540 [Pirellulaceae bacterium]